MQHISNYFVNIHLKHRELIPLLEQAYIRSEIITGVKSLNSFGARDQNGIMSMSAWSKDYAGTKLLMIMPDNPAQDLPSIRGVYILNDAVTGELLCTLDAEEMTSIRTACASALASLKLSKQDSKSMLLLGNGALAKDMIIAHCAVRPLQQIYIWGRNELKSEAVKSSLIDELQQNIIVLKEYKDIVRDVDIICSATGASTPLIHQEHISNGQHIDLVGSYQPSMQELDERVLGIASVYADDLENTPKKVGEFCKAFEKGIIKKADIRGDLVTLSSADYLRENDEEVTIFKSSGMAIQDLVCASFLYQKSKDT